MSSMRVKPAFSFRFKEMSKGAGVFLFVILAVVALFATTAARSGNGYTTLSALGMATAVFMFVMGICTVREQLRLCIQLGAGRLTSFVSELLSAVAITLILCAGGELLMAGAQAASAGNAHLTVTDIYQLVYVGLDTATMTFTQHVLSALTNFAFALCGYVGGAFISLVFFRLSKSMKILVAVGVPLLLIFGMPMGITELGFSAEFSAAVSDFMDWIAQGVGNWLLLFLGGAAVFGAFNWLLMRRAPITEAKG